MLKISLFYPLYIFLTIFEKKIKTYKWQKIFIQNGTSIIRYISQKMTKNRVIYFIYKKIVKINKINSYIKKCNLFILWYFNAIDVFITVKIKKI